MSAATVATAADPWTVWLEPGVYDLGTSYLNVPDHVSILGSGAAVTTITGRSSIATVNLAEGDELADLHIVNTRTTDGGTVVRLLGAHDAVVRDLRVTGVTAEIYGVQFASPSDRVRLDGVVVSAGDIGVLIGRSADAVIRDSEISSDGDSAVGLNSGEPAQVRIENSRLESSSTLYGAVRAIATTGTYEIEIHGSTIVTPRTSFQPNSSDTDDVFKMFHTHVDAGLAFPATGGTTVYCAQNSSQSGTTPAAGLNNVCY